MSGSQHFLVLSSPPEGVTDAQYDAWYDTHVDELLARVPQFVAAERCHLQLHSNSSSEPEPYRFLTRYTIEDGEGFDEAWAALRAAVDSGEMTFDDWFGGVVSAGFVCTTVMRQAKEPAP
jgi:hypothetical protein